MQNFGNRRSVQKGAQNAGSNVLKCGQCNLTFFLLSPLEIGCDLSFEQTESLSPTGAVCPVWLKLVWWLWRKR